MFTWCSIHPRSFDLTEVLEELLKVLAGWVGRIVYDFDSCIPAERCTPSSLERLEEFALRGGEVEKPDEDQPLALLELVEDVLGVLRCPAVQESIVDIAQLVEAGCEAVIEWMKAFPEA